MRIGVLTITTFNGISAISEISVVNRRAGKAFSSQRGIYHFFGRTYFKSNKLPRQLRIKWHSEYAPTVQMHR
jgi:hypothetical protein